MMSSLLPAPSYRVFSGASDSSQSHSRHATRSTRVYVATKRRQGEQDPDDEGLNDGHELPSGLSRREFMMRSVAFAALGAQADSLTTTDGRTVINSILGAYGLPKITGAKGFREFDDFDEEYTFQYPSSWVRRKNTLRSGVYIADFQTADKLSVEVFPLPEGVSVAADKDGFAQVVLERLLNPAREVGGNSRIELPRPGLIKCQVKEQDDGIPYAYIAFPSATTTRSGYDVRRKNVAVAAVKRGVVYCLGTSSRSDQWNNEKAALLEQVVESFRLRKGGKGKGGDVQEV